MKIAWFSPFNNKSAIGLVSKYIIEELARNHQVDLWLHEDTNLLGTDVPIISYSQNKFEPKKLTGYDAVFYILGDNFEYHGPIYMISQLVPGIVILHDYVMHHFFTGFFFIYLNDYNKYITEMGKFYGAKGKLIAHNSLNNNITPIWESNDVIHYSFIEKCIVGARGVFTHSQFVKKNLQPFFLGPIEVQYLPYEPFIKKGSSSPGSPNKSSILYITSLGYVNSNRCHEHIIRVIGSNEQFKKSVKYLIAGPYNSQDPYYHHLISLIQQLGLVDTVRFTDYLSDNEFHSIVTKTDLFFNLRIPAMEGGSATLLEEMVSGKPVVVADTGVYNEIPDNCVLKIRCDNIENDIISILKNFILDPTRFSEYGDNGKKYVLNNCNIMLYIQSLEKLIKEVQIYSPIQKMVDKVGDELLEMGVSNDMDYPINDISNQMKMMFRY